MSGTGSQRMAKIIVYPSSFLLLNYNFRKMDRRSKWTQRPQHCLRSHPRGRRNSCCCSRASIGIRPQLQRTCKPSKPSPPCIVRLEGTALCLVPLWYHGVRENSYCLREVPPSIQATLCRQRYSLVGRVPWARDRPLRRHPRRRHPPPRHPRLDRR